MKNPPVAGLWLSIFPPKSSLPKQRNTLAILFKVPSPEKTSLSSSLQGILNRFFSHVFPLIKYGGLLAVYEGLALSHERCRFQPYNRFPIPFRDLKVNSFIMCRVKGQEAKISTEEEMHSANVRSLEKDIESGLLFFFVIVIFIVLFLVIFLGMVKYELKFVDSAQD